MRALSLPAQGALFAAAAEALTPSYRRWCDASGTEPQSRLLSTVIATARNSPPPSPAMARSLLSRIETVAPSGPSDAADFTGAQDCWICADVSVRVFADSADASIFSWYLLEPLLQSVSVELFGVEDVGSELEDELETRLLLADRTVQAIENLNESVDALIRSPQADIAALMSRICP